MTSTTSTVRRLGVAALAAGALVLAGCSNHAPNTEGGPATSSVESTPVTSAPASPTASDSAAATPEETPSGPMDIGSASATPTIAAPSGTLKKASTAVLPQTLGAMKGQVSEQGDTTIGQYTGSSEDQMLVATLTKGQQRSAALALLSNPVTEGHTTCGTIAATGLAGCYLWLDGGNIQLYGTDQTTTETLRSQAEKLWEQLA